MQSAGEYFPRPPLISSACMRAKLAARICSSLIVWASDDVVKTTATADMHKNDVQERIIEDMVLVFTPTSLTASCLRIEFALHNFSTCVVIEDSVAACFDHCHCVPCAVAAEHCPARVRSKTTRSPSEGAWHKLDRLPRKRALVLIEPSPSPRLPLAS